MTLRLWLCLVVAPSLIPGSDRTTELQSLIVAERFTSQRTWRELGFVLAKRVLGDVGSDDEPALIGRVKLSVASLLISLRLLPRAHREERSSTLAVLGSVSAEFADIRGALRYFQLSAVAHPSLQTRANVALLLLKTGRLQAAAAALKASLLAPLTKRDEAEWARMASFVVNR